MLTALAVVAVLAVSDRAHATSFFPGSTTLSVDNSSAVGGTGTYATIQQILFFEGAPDDFAPGVAHTLTLVAPAGFEFEGGSGSLSIGAGGDITVGSLESVTASAITISFTTDSTDDGSDSITVSDVRARPTTTTAATGQIQASAASTATIVGLVRQGDPGTVTNFGTLNTIAGVPSGNLVVEPLDSNATNGSGGPAAALNAGVTFAARIRALDRFGNPATIGSQGTPATIAFSSNATASPDGTAPTIPATATPTFTSGRAEVGGFTLTNAAAAPTITATVQAAGTTNLGSVSAGTSAGLTVNAGAVDDVVLTTQPGGATAGMALAPQPVASVVDAFDNPISTAATGVQLVASVTGGGVALQGTATVALDATGVATYTDLQVDTAGDHTLTFTAGAVSEESAAISVVAATPNTLLVQPLDTNTAGGSPTTALTAGTEFAVRITVTDQFLNPALDVDGNVGLAFTTNAGDAPDGTPPVVGALSGAIGFTDGVGTVTNFMLTDAAAAQTITATVQDAGVGGNLAAPASGVAGTSAGATVSAGTPVALTPVSLNSNAVDGTGSPTTSLAAGTPFAIRISLADQYDNVATTTSGNVALLFTTNAASAPDGTAPTVTTLSGVQAFASGVVEVGGFVFTNAGAGQTITATVANAGVGGNLAAPMTGTAGATPAASVAAGAPAALTVATLDANTTDGSAAPTTTLTAGSPFAVRISAFDEFDNPATQVTGQVGLAFTTNADSAPNGVAPTVTSRSGSHPFASGVAEVAGFALTNAAAGQTVTATVQNAGAGGNLAQPANGLFATSAAAAVATGTPTVVLRAIDPATGNDAATFIAGSAFTVRVLVADAFENPIADVNGDVDLVFTTNADAAPDGTTPTVNSRSGVYVLAAATADVTGFILPAAATGRVITAMVQNAGAAGNLATPATGAGDSTGDLTIQPATLDRFLVEANGGGAIGAQTYGTPFAIQVRAVDEFDNVLASGPNDYDGPGNTVELSSSVVGATGTGTTPAFGHGVLAGHMVTLSTLTGAATLIATDTHPGGLGNGTQTGASAAFAVVASANANLSALSAAGATLMPVFSAATTGYDGAVASSVSAVDVSATPADANATSLTIGGAAAVPGMAQSVALATGVNAIPVVVVAQDGVTTMTYTVTITRAAPPPPPPPPPAGVGGSGGGGAPPAATPTPTPTPAPTPTPTPAPMPRGAGGVNVPIANARVVAIAAGMPASVTTQGAAGSGGISVAANLLTAGSEIHIAAIPDLVELDAAAPAPAGASLALGYVVTAIAPDGTVLPGPFSPRAQLTMTLAASRLPGGASVDDLAIAHWDGNGWVQLCASAVQLADGSFAFETTVDRFSVFAVVAVPGRAMLLPDPVDAGVNSALWCGGPLPRMVTAVPPAMSYWVFASGDAVGYIPGAPAFVNGAFEALYPDNRVPDRTIVLVVLPGD